MVLNTFQHIENNDDAKKNVALFIGDPEIMNGLWKKLIRTIGSTLDDEAVSRLKRM
jgi:hypothetical protein